MSWTLVSGLAYADEKRVKGFNSEALGLHSKAYFKATHDTSFKAFYSSFLTEFPTLQIQS